MREGPVDEQVREPVGSSDVSVGPVSSPRVDVERE